MIHLTVENQIMTEVLTRKRTDIGFFIPGFNYIIECKKISSITKSNYIDNGILRFINNVYIKENITYAGMCCFVFNEIETILINAKNKVSEYHSKKTIDEKIICNYPNSFYSKHYKINNQELMLHHLFFDFS